MKQCCDQRSRRSLYFDHFKWLAFFLTFIFYSGFSYANSSQPPLPLGQGDFKVANYATGIANINFVNRGYVFKPSRDVVVNGMWGGFGPNCQEFQGGIYEVTPSGSGTEAAPGWRWGQEMASVTFRDGIALTPEFRPFQTPVTLSKDKYYLIYQGRTIGGSGCHLATQNLDFTNLQIGSAIIDDWFPKMQAQYVVGSPTAGSIFTSTDSVRILVGFRYDTDVILPSLANVATTAFQLQGTNNVVVSGILGDSGQASNDQALTLYFEYATNPSFTNSVLSPAAPFTVLGPASDVPFGITVNNLNAGTTYWIRAVAINEAGRVNANAISFTVGSMSTGVQVSASAGSGGSVTPAVRAVQVGETTSFLVQPNSGFVVDFNVGGSCPQGAWQGNTWTTAVITEACTVAFNFNLSNSVISFNPNGGAGNLADISAPIGSSITLPTNPFTRLGYSFSGWNSSADGSGTTYLNEAGFTVGQSDITLYAQWSINQYTVSFDSAGGSVVAPITQNFASAITSPDNPIREGYTFTGWTPAIPTTMPAENTTVVAGWSVNSYTLSFSTGIGSAVSSITADFGSVLSAPADPLREGYTFSGWSPAFPATMPATSMTLEALWTINQYTVTFDSNGGSSVAPVTADFGSALTAPANPTREGYTFGGWSPAFPATMPSSNVTVTAQWSINSYTVTFDSNGGSTVAPVTADFGSALTAPANPTREGYTFAGWSPALPSTMPSSNVTVTAQWAINQYTVTFDSNGGSDVAPITADFGSALTAPANPTREGYTFIGWNPAFPATMPAGDITITAQWELNIYTVRFLDWDDTVLQVLQIPHGEAAVLPLLPERVGFRFIGWSEALDRIAGDLDVRALYEELSYEVSVSVSGAATVTPEQQVVLYGRRASFGVNLTNADDVVVVNSECGASYQAGEIITAPIFAACSIAVTVYDPVQVEADITAPGPINQIRRFTVFGGSGHQRLLEADITRAGRAVPMTEDEVKTVLTRLDDGSYRFTASRTGRYSFRFVDVASGQVVEISFDILPYLAFTSSQQQLEPGQSSSVTVWLSDEAIEYPVRANLVLEQVMLSATAVVLREEDALRQSYTLNAVAQSGSVAISQQGVANALVGTPERHRVLVVDEPAPLSLFGEASQQARVTTVVSRRNGIVQLSARENNAVPVSFSWSANGLPLQAEGERASFDPSNVALGAYTVTISATDGRRNGRYELLLRVIDACNFESCDTETGIPAANNPLRDSTNRLLLCPLVENVANRVERCEQQGVVFAEVPNLYTLSLGLFSGDISWQTEQFGLALNDGSLQDAGFTQVGYTVNLDILALLVPGESVPVMIPLPVGTTIPKDAVWRKFTNMQWHNFVEDANNVVQSAARDALGQCPVVSSDVWEEGLVEGYGCIRLIIEDGGPNDDDALANGVIRDPGVLAVRNSYTLTFNSNGGSAVAPVTQLFGSALNIVPPVREGHTFVGWSPALPETMPSENVTYTAQWQVNAYQIRFDTAGGQAIAPLTVNFGSAIVAPVPVRQGYTFKGWNPVLPATMPAGDLQVTAQWYESSVQVTSKGGSMHALWLVGLGLLAWLRRSRLGLVWLAVLLPATAQSSVWFMEASVGHGRSQSSEAAINQQLNTVLRGDAEIIKNRDTAYRFTLGYQLSEDWYVEAGWTELGKLVVGYANLPEGTTNQALLAVQPQRGHGVEIASRYYVVSGERYQGYVRAGYLINRERYKFEWPRGTELEYNPEANWVLGKGRDQNLVLGVGMDYRLNNTLALGVSWQQYDTERAKTRLVLLNLQYRF